MVSRRDLFLGAAAVAAAGCAQSGGRAQSGAQITKAVLISMLPKGVPYEERFQIAKAAGFTAMEAQTVKDDDEAKLIAAAAEKTGLRIHSVMNMEHWAHPLSSPDPADLDASVAGMEASLRQAKIYGADAVLLVPGVVRDDTTYEQAWERSMKVIRERILPVAEQNDVVVAMEEVWNKFLLTPRDFVQYVDEFNHPLVKAYFDVGNVVHYGVPQHWIDALGDRIVKVHLKDYSRQAGFVNLGDAGEGGVEWPKVRQAFDNIGYEGYATVELKGGDQAYLADVAQRVDKLLALS
ncbi:MAG: sugar phosphate isomerase/epimerase [Bryobacterales bacterium]|nr:sugar phosphate isomerase/epimerase [Bryobacterales bacterium]